MDAIFSCGTSSTAHTYGNVTAFLREHLLSKFPHDFFKYIYVSSEMTFRFLGKRGKNNLLKGVEKRQRPLLIIRPVYEAQEDDVFLSRTLLTDNVHDVEGGISRKSLFPVIHDKSHLYQMRYKINRDRLNFEIQIQVRNLHAQLDLYKSMVNLMVWDKPYLVSTHLESMIPRAMIHYISKIIGCDIDNPKGVSRMLEYLQTVSTYPITYKVKNSTSNDEFFMYYAQRLLVTLTDLTIDEGNKKNMADDYYTITFRASVEFNLPGTFVLLGTPTKEIKQINMEAIISDGLSLTDFIPIFTYDRIFDDDKYRVDGYRMYTSTIIKADKNQEKEVLDISPLFNDDVTEIIKTHNFNNVPAEILFRTLMVKDRIELIYEKDYFIDWNRMELYIYNSDIDATYRLIFYVNGVYLAEKILEINDRNDKTLTEIDNSKDKYEVVDSVDRKTIMSSDGVYFTPKV